VRYLSVCSGIEAATVAWHPLGWTPAAFSEIEAFPRAVLKHHYPEVPLHGDFTTIRADEYGPIDLLVGGTPCQSFSVAGLRGGLDDVRGNLALEFLRLADRKRPRWLAWENVPGVLSSNEGRDFGSILGGMVELGYGIAYRVLDAQHFGVPQRRRRVFVVGYLGDWRRAAAVLFERHSLSGHPPPKREPGQGVAGTLKACAGKSGTPNGAEEADRLVITQFGDMAGALTARHDSSPCADRGMNVVAFSGQSLTCSKDVSPCLDTGAEHHNRGVHVAAFMENQRAELRISDQTDALACGGGKPGQGYAAALTGSSVRRLTPRECERLQGFPDDYTLVPYRGKPAADGPRYKALGNSMAVPCMVWLGQRIQMVDDIAKEMRDAA
jgi:DNA (cytosine-5)-methyltransferase 1